LIDDNPIEEDDSDNESTGSRKRKKSDDEDDDELDDRLEEEDYDLLEENLGVKVQRVRVIPVITVTIGRQPTAFLQA